MDVIITGASRGLGRAIAEIFAENGYNLYLTSLQETRLYKAMEELVNTYPAITIKAKPFDLSKKEQAQAFGQWCLKNCSPDILVNNAGNFTGANVYRVQTGLYFCPWLTRKV